MNDTTSNDVVTALSGLVRRVVGLRASFLENHPVYRINVVKPPWMAAAQAQRQAAQADSPGKQRRYFSTHDPVAV